jgi:hypothetical protein
MNTHKCQFEQEIVNAVRSGKLTEQLRQHSATCLLCKQSIVVAQAINSVREITAQEIPAIPGYRLIWLKAQFTQKQERLFALDVVSLLGLSLVGALMFLGIVFWKLPQLSSWTLELFSSSTSSWMNSFPLNIPVAVVIAFVLAVWVFTLESYFSKSPYQRKAHV